MLKGKYVVLGVTGSIAAYKAATLASMLVQAGARVQVIMTRNATNIINPITFETLTGLRCLTDTFDRNFEHSVEHVSIAQQADAFIIAPSTANAIAKAASGLADDMLSTTFLACDCPKLVAPAMNTRMYENPVTQDNLEKCRRYGIRVIEPAEGHLACGDSGRGKMPEPKELLAHLAHVLSDKQDFCGKRVLVTAGPTQEALDPVRFLTNHSSGKMGYAIATAAARRGADVTLVSGPVALEPPLYVRTVPVTSAMDMAAAVKERCAEQDVIIKAAAVADYRPATTSDQKIKKGGGLTLELERTEDILGFLGEHRTPGQILCGFSMETENLVENSRAKLRKKHLDLVVANSLKVAGAGFGTDTNVVTLITADGETELPLMGKDAVADAVLDAIAGRLS